MNIFENIYYSLLAKYYNIRSGIYTVICKMRYPDYEDNEYNCGSLKHIWGVTSYLDLSGKDSSLYTMNDIDITYDRKSKLYMLGIETAYMFKGNRKEGECKYLRGLLKAFTKFMDDNNYSKEYDKCLFMTRPTILDSADSIEELYINFKMFVEGYCRVYGGEI